MKAFSAFLATLMVGALAATPVAAQEMKFFRIGTGSAGATYFPIGGLIANAISNPPGSRPCDKGGACGVPGLVAIAVSTNASVANVNAIQAGQLEAGLSGAVTIFEAYNGAGAFANDKKGKLRMIANLFPEDLHLIMPKDAKLASLKDLKGKRVGIGQAGSETQVSVLRILAHYGITRNDISASELNMDQSSQRIADGQIDAYFYAVGTPAAALVQLGSTKGFELYRFSPEEQKVVNQLLPYYVDSVISAGTYEAIKYDVPTMAVPGQLVTSVDQPENLIYEITKAMWNDNSRKLFDNGHSKGKVIRLESALKGLQIPLHPGAEKFYREKGMIK